jgi:RNA polymerase sigma factor (sigma-70 family)
MDDPEFSFERQDSGIMIQEVNHILQHDLARLTDREYLILQLRFGIGTSAQHQHTLQKVADLLGYSKERIRQIQNLALAKVRKALEFGTKTS